MQVGIHERASLLFVMVIGVMGLIGLIGLISPIPPYLLLFFHILLHESNGLNPFGSVIRRTDERSTYYMFKTFL